MRVLLERGGTWAVGRHGGVAIEAKFTDGLAKLGVIARAVGIMATETGYAVTVHHALHKVITLHSIFVCGAIRKVCKGLLA